MKRYLDRNGRLADYIYKDMDPEEMVMIERELQGDPEFSEAYLLNREVKNYLQAKIQLEEMRSDPELEAAELLADLAFDKEASGKKQGPGIPAVRRHKRKTIRAITFTAALAASIAAIIAVGIIPSFTGKDQLFERFYEPISASDYTQRGTSNAMYHEIGLGINHYLEGNFSLAIEQFSKLAPDPVLQTEVQFFTALSHLGLGEYRDAQSILESLAGARIRYQAEVLWYLSLSYVKTGAFDEADKHLAQLELYEGMYKRDAQVLRKKLRRLRE